MTADLLGITALMLTALCVLLVTRIWPVAAKILWVAFAVRAGLALCHHYIFPLPDSGSDAKRFDWIAWEWAQGGFGEVWVSFPGPDPYLISWIIALFYAVLERSSLMAQSFSVFLGTGTVFLGWLLIRELWGTRVATRASWILVFFPSLALYSSVVLRGAYICFFLLIGLLGAVRWSRSRSIRSLILATFGFVGATFFHGAMIVGLLTFGFVVVWRSTKHTVSSLRRRRVPVYAIMTTLLAWVLIGGFLIDAFSFPYIGNFSNASNMETLVSRVQGYTRLEDGAAYPWWTVPNSPIELIYKTPIRIIYFLFSPLPWDVKKSSHFIGLLDGFCYMILIISMWRNRKVIWTDPAARLLLIILAAYIFVFGFTVGNFGTGTRHRAKFVVMVIALVAPIFARIRFRLVS